MARMHLINRLVRIGVPGIAVVLFATGARGEMAPPNQSTDGDRTCMTAFKTAQEREQAGHLVEASQLFYSCDVDTCSTALWEECAASAARLHASLPSVVPLVVDAVGQPRIDMLNVRVKMDGALLTSQIDGRALPVDPGTHEFSFDMGGVVLGTQKVTILKGQRNRTIALALRVAEKTGSSNLKK